MPTQGMVPLRNWFQNQGLGVSWDPNKKTVSAGGFNFGPNDYTMHNNQTYVNPSNLANMYAARPAPQFDAQKGMDFANKTWGPVYDERLKSFSNQLSQISGTADAQRRTAENEYQRSASNLGRQEKSSREQASHSISARNIASSPLAEYQRRKVTESYAPMHEQLENSRATQMANISEQAARSAEQLASQGRELEAEFASRIAQTAWQMYQQELTSHNQQNQSIVSQLMGMDQRNLGLDQQNWQRGVTEAGMTGLYQGQPTMQGRQVTAGITGIDPVTGSPTYENQFNVQKLTAPKQTATQTKQAQQVEAEDYMRTHITKFKRPIDFVEQARRNYEDGSMPAYVFKYIKDYMEANYEPYYVFEHWKK